MNFNAPLLRPIRILLFPFSLLYAAVVWIRNRMFDRGMIASSSFNLPVINVGNLSAGGTGKSPMVEWLLKSFHQEYRLAVLSRGYKRKTRGYALASAATTALDIGDEPMQFYSKFPDVAIAVGEERIVAIPQLLHDRPETEAIILDDAFQHRYVRAGLNILLTDCNNLFTRDWYLPTGDLRDNKSSYKRADIIIVTKCPENLQEVERAQIIEEIAPLPHQRVFFTTIKYGIPYHILHRAPYQLNEQTEVLLVSGIANPKPLKKFLLHNTATYDELLYNDHHVFTIDDWNDIARRFNAISSPEKIILTTEKDAVRLVKFSQSLASYPLYVMPIEVSFLFDEESVFTGIISKFIKAFKRKKEEN